jgi:hypothetical protein
LALVSRVSNKYLNDPYVFIFESSSPIAISLNDIISHRYKHNSDIYIFILSGSIRDLIDEKAIYPSKLESESGPLLQMPSTKNVTTNNTEADSFFIHKNSKTLNQSNQTKSNSLSHLPSMNNLSSSNVTATQPILISELISEFSDGDSFLKNKKLKTLNQTNQIKFGSLLNSSTNNSSSSNITSTKPILIIDSTRDSLEGDPLLNNKSSNTLNQINNQNLNQNLDSNPGTLQIEIDKLKKDPYEINFSHIHDLDVITTYIYY